MTDRNNLQEAKAAVRDYSRCLDSATVENMARVGRSRIGKGYDWYGVHPFNRQHHYDDVIEVFWRPLHRAWHSLQRREDIFMAGINEMDSKPWCVSMGHFMGVMSEEWLGIPRVPGIAFLRYAEFFRVEDGLITGGAFFCDIVDLMRQANLHPLPMQTGASFLYPGPRTHDGLLLDPQDPEQGRQTAALVNRMIDDLDALNKSGDDHCPPELLRQTWHEDMLWYGPAGIGAFHTIPEYRNGHQVPFRRNLSDKRFNGHVCRLAEGNYAGFFGWPNLTNTPSGGFLGMPASNTPADMRVVDIYRRQGDRLAENWVLMDIPHWLLQQGVDIINRSTEIHRKKRKC